MRSVQAFSFKYTIGYIKTISKNNIIICKSIQLLLIGCYTFVLRQIEHTSCKLINIIVTKQSLFISLFRRRFLNLQQIHEYCGIMSTAESWVLWNHEYCVIMSTVESWVLRNHEYCGIMSTAESWVLRNHEYCGIMSTAESRVLRNHEYCGIMSTAESWGP